MAKKTETVAVESSKVVAIPRPDRRSLNITIVGTSTLIVHRFGPKAIRMMEEKQQKKAKIGRIAKVPREEYEECLYLDADGTHCFPSSGLRNAIVDAAGFTGKAIAKTTARGSLFIPQDLIPIVGEVSMRTDPVRLGGKTADIRYRPEYTGWQMTFLVEYANNILTDEELVNLIELSGMHVGIGEWRPQRNGSHGMYRVAGI